MRRADLAGPARNASAVGGDLVDDAVGERTERGPRREVPRPRLSRTVGQTRRPRTCGAAGAWERPSGPPRTDRRGAARLPMRTGAAPRSRGDASNASPAPGKQPAARVCAVKHEPDAVSGSTGHPIRWIGDRSRRTARRPRDGHPIIAGYTLSRDAAVAYASRCCCVKPWGAPE